MYIIFHMFSAILSHSADDLRYVTTDDRVKLSLNFWMKQPEAKREIEMHNPISQSFCSTSRTSIMH